MKKAIKNTILWILIKIHSIFLMLSIALRNTEIGILKADPDDLDESKKRTTRKLHHNQILEKFYAGQTDQKYVKDYYKLLKKADKFILNASERDMAIAADKNSMSYGMKDKWGRRYEHYGFFDSKHKHAGKTLGEVIELEKKERRTKDDDYELIAIFNNKPIEIGLSKIDQVVDKEYKLKDLHNKSRTFEFPIKVSREGDVVNKIEQLTEYLHVKHIGFEHRQLEFFIPLKYKIDQVKEDDKIFKDLINLNEIYINDQYDNLVGYRIDEFIKRINFEDTHEVWKFKGVELEVISKY